MKESIHHALERACGRGRCADRNGDRSTWGDICDGDEKRHVLLAACAELGIDPKQAIVVGDGSNDLAMMEVTGLSVAYRAKPKVRERAMVSIDEGGLDRLLALFEDT